MGQLSLLTATVVPDPNNVDFIYMTETDGNYILHVEKETAAEGSYDYGIDILNSDG